MKINYRRIIKVLSSCVAIAMVLIVTVAMPVFAVSNKVYRLSDLFYTIRTEGDDVITSYSLTGSDISPYIFLIVNGQRNGFVNGRIFEVELDGTYPENPDATSTFDFRTYILGVENSNTSKPYLLDISDLKHLSSLRLSMTLTFHGGFAESLSGLLMTGQWAVVWLSADGSVLGNSRTLLDNYSTHDGFAEGRFDLSGDLVIPEDAVYMIPQIDFNIHAYDGYYLPSSCYFELEYGYFDASYNSVVENSATMNRIEQAIDSIGDVLDSVDQSLLEGNHKLDEIINGNDEMAGQAQDSSEELQSAQDELRDAVDNFDAATNLDELLPDRAEADLDISSLISRRQLVQAWHALLSRFKPILEYGDFPKILLMVVACINISVLLIGR